MQAKWQQRRVRAGRWCAHTDVRSVPALEDQMHLRGFDGSDGEVDKRRQEEAEREGGGG